MASSYTIQSTRSCRCLPIEASSSPPPTRAAYRDQLKMPALLAIASPWAECMDRKLERHLGSRLHAFRSPFGGGAGFRSLQPPAGNLLHLKIPVNAKSLLAVLAVECGMCFRLWRTGRILLLSKMAQLGTGQTPLSGTAGRSFMVRMGLSAPASTGPLLLARADAA